MSNREFKVALRKKVMPDINELSAAVDEVADSNDVGSIVKPSDAPVTTATVTPLPKKERPARRQVPAETTQLTIKIPVYLAEAIDKKRTLHTTKRYIVLKAFKDAGYEVREADFLEDGRRGHE